MHNTTGNPNLQGFDYSNGYLCQKQAHNYYPTHLWENGKWDTLNNPPISVRIGNWKGVKTQMKTNPAAKWELYDLSSDRSEQKNRAGELPQRVSELDKVVEREHVPSHIKDWEFVSPKFKRN